MCRAKKLLVLVLCCVCAFVCALHSSASYAIDFSTDVEFVDGVSQPRIYPLNYVCAASVCNGFSNAWTSFLTSTQGGIKDYLHEIPNRQYQYGDIIMLGYNLTVSANTVANHSSFAGLRYAGTNPVNVLYTDVSQLNDTGGTVYVYLWVYNTFTDSNLKLEALDGGFSWYLQAGNGGTGQSLKLLNVQVLRQKNTSSPDYSSALGTIQGGISDVNRNLNNVQDSIDQSNQDANDRYDDEKNTIQDNGDNAVGAWTDNEENLSFNAPTGLFNWFWSLGTTEECISISTLARLIHSNETTYCSWWSTEIRSIVSPIVNIFLVCIISGFIIKWLRKDGI